MIIIEGRGTISVTEPGKSTCAYYEDCEIHVYGLVVHFLVHNKFKTAPLANCMVSWKEPPAISQAS